LPPFWLLLVQEPSSCHNVSVAVYNHEFKQKPVGWEP